MANKTYRRFDQDHLSGRSDSLHMHKREHEHADAPRSQEPWLQDADAWKKNQPNTALDVVNFCDRYDDIDASPSVNRIADITAKIVLAAIMICTVAAPFHHRQKMREIKQPAAPQNPTPSFQPQSYSLDDMRNIFDRPSPNAPKAIPIMKPAVSPSSFPRGIPFPSSHPTNSLYPLIRR